MSKIIIIIILLLLILIFAKKLISKFTSNFFYQFIAYVFIIIVLIFSIFIYRENNIHDKKGVYEPPTYDGNLVIPGKVLSEDKKNQ
tara:strand:- start:194 stop:451 length:258 start_codon:yes stop_codon:yes gene_type:complete